MSVDIYTKVCIHYVYIYPKVRNQKRDVLDWIFDKKNIFQPHKYFGCIS